ncbi:MAG: AI-2E family transporter [Deltaproteobacteria bacterium]
MALPKRQQMLYWGIAAAVFFLLLWYLSGVLVPFIIAGAIAYILDPMADRLEVMGFSRAMATTTISLLALLLFVVIVLLVVPTLVSQAVGLASAAPDMFGKVTTWLTEKFPALLDTNSQLRQSLDEVGAEIKSHGGALFNSVIASALSVVNVVLLMVLVPVITFYLLLDWDTMIAKVDGLLPRDHAPVIRRLANEISATLASFIRGQGLVCLILGSYYAIGLFFCGLQFGLIVGALAGLVTFIPYVGALLGGALAIGLALFQFWGEWGWVAAVAIVFVVGQFLEGNVLTPKLVGKSVGLHPVWLIFALSAFGAVFGFAGLLIAVPMAAAMGVLMRFAISQYQSSLLFKGKEAAPKPRRRKSDDTATDV